MRPALLVIDMQKQFATRPQAKASMEAAAEYIAYVIKLFEKKKLPIIHILHDEGGKDAPKAEDFWEIDRVAVADRSTAIIKSHGSGFSGTDLEARLRACGAELVLVCGFSAEYCVLSTTRAAYDLGWKPIILVGGIASADESVIPFVYKINDTITAGALETVLG